MQNIYWLPIDEENTPTVCRFCYELALEMMPGIGTMVKRVAPIRFCEKCGKEGTMATCIQLKSGFACGKETENGAERCKECAAYHNRKELIVLTECEPDGDFVETTHGAWVSHYFGTRVINRSNIRWSVQRLEDLGFRVQVVKQERKEVKAMQNYEFESIEFDFQLNDSETHYQPLTMITTGRDNPIFFLTDSLADGVAFGWKQSNVSNHLYCYVERPMLAINTVCEEHNYDNFDWGSAWLHGDNGDYEASIANPYHLFAVDENGDGNGILFGSSVAACLAAFESHPLRSHYRAIVHKETGAGTTQWECEVAYEEPLPEVEFNSYRGCDVGAYGDW